MRSLALVFLMVAVGCETFPPNFSKSEAVSVTDAVGLAENPRFACPNHPMSGRECQARLAESYAQPAWIDAPLDFDGDGTLGGGDFALCRLLGVENEGHRAFSCPAPTAEVCVARLKAAWGKPVSADPWIDLDGDGVFGGRDFTACAQLP